MNFVRVQREIIKYYRVNPSKYPLVKQNALIDEIVHYSTHFILFIIYIMQIITHLHTAILINAYGSILCILYFRYNIMQSISCRVQIII